MLYDPKWDIFSLASLIRWLEQQPADRHYSPLPEDTCLLGQFASAMGAGDVRRKSIELGNTVLAKVAFDFNHETDCNFGDALKRARAIAHD